MWLRPTIGRFFAWRPRTKSKLLARRAISFVFLMGGGMDSRLGRRDLDDTAELVFGRRCSIESDFDSENT